MYQLKKDNILKFEGTADECYMKLQKLQSQSAHHAIKYEGWSVTKKTV